MASDIRPKYPAYRLQSLLQQASSFTFKLDHFPGMYHLYMKAGINFYVVTLCKITYIMHILCMETEKPTMIKDMI
jgi:hypothetical protein